jgi:hypothetical protein
MHQGAPRYGNTEHVMNKLLKQDLEKIKGDMFNEHVDEFAKTVGPCSSREI